MFEPPGPKSKYVSLKSMDWTSQGGYDIRVDPPAAINEGQSISPFIRDTNHPTWGANVNGLPWQVDP